ncbi:MAG TPA: IS701 family transposase [Mycobacterium sp.]|nr:IS701 family transposase [Mycobacterium sp.]
MAASAIVEAGQVEVKLAELMGHLSVHFSRREPVVQAGKYLRGLLSDLPRKNCWTLAEYAGDKTPDRMQRLLERASWDSLAAMGTVRDFVAEHLGQDGGPAILVLDESGVEKTGTATCGTKRQYVGCAGKVANAVNVVNATYSTDRGHALIGSRIYLPAEHCDDPATRQRMGIPDDLEFRTKPQLGADLLVNAVEAGVRVDWCTGDAVYGRDRALREACEKRGIGYSLGVPCSFRIRLPSGLRLRADAAVRFVAAGGWQVASCGPGSKGDRRYDWAWLATAGQRHFLLIRRSLRNPAELAFFYCWVPASVPATLRVLTTVTGRRWTIEEDHQIGKDQFGYDHFQTRLHTPILRHLVLVMAALAVCAITCADTRTPTEAPRTPISRTEPPPDDIGLIPLTVTEIKRLFNLATRAWQPILHHLHWSEWRRRHQARARWYHHRSRLT